MGKVQASQEVPGGSLEPSRCRGRRHFQTKGSSPVYWVACDWELSALSPGGGRSLVGDVVCPVEPGSRVRVSLLWGTETAMGSF